MKEPKTLEEALAVIGSANEENAALSEDNKKLTAGINKLQDENKALKAEIAEKDSLVSGLRKESAKAKTYPTFKHEGKTYEVILPKVKHEGETITDEDICKNKELQAHFVKIEASVVREQAK